MKLSKKRPLRQSKPKLNLRPVAESKAESKRPSKLQQTVKVRSKSSGRVKIAKSESLTPQIVRKDDLGVDFLSSSLSGKRLDVIVSGSIAAVESVRFIRSLRRLGATVTPWITTGGSKFVTPLALEWASAAPCMTTFSGIKTHLATSDAVVVAPASANVLSKMAQGITGEPHLALLSSAIGQEIPVILLPTMHDSMFDSPLFRKNLDTLSLLKSVHIIEPRTEEGKRKFPDPEVMADQVSHIICRKDRPLGKILITMGPTRGYIDQVRFMTSDSSGKTGQEISHELYRHGFNTLVVCGPSPLKPKCYFELHHVSTTTEMLEVCKKAIADSKRTNSLGSKLIGAVFAASVLDYEPTTTLTGKTRSGRSDLTVELSPTKKVIQLFAKTNIPKLAFKLEVSSSSDELNKIASKYFNDYGLERLYVNDIKHTKAHTRALLAYGGKKTPPKKLNGYQELNDDVLSVFVTKDRRF